jgi:hypothetical protein
MKSRTTILFIGLGGLALLGPPTIAFPQGDPPPGQAFRVVPADGSDREAREPQVAVDPQGRIFVIFGVGDTVRCARSSDGEKTFEVATVGSPGVLSLGMRRGPRVAVAGDSVVVSAIGAREGKGRDGDLMAWCSTDTGKT